MRNTLLHFAYSLYLRRHKALLFMGNSNPRHNDGCEDQSPAGGPQEHMGENDVCGTW